MEQVNWHKHSNEYNFFPGSCYFPIAIFSIFMMFALSGFCTPFSCLIFFFLRHRKAFHDDIQWKGLGNCFISFLIHILNICTYVYKYTYIFLSIICTMSPPKNLLAFYPNSAESKLTKQKIFYPFRGHIVNFPRMCLILLELGTFSES